MNIPDLVDDSNNEDDEPYVGEDALEGGDQVFTVTIPCEVEFIRATSNVSQRLAKAFHKNAQPKTFGELVPTHLHDFKDLFTKSSFDQLLIGRSGTMRSNSFLMQNLQTVKSIPSHGHPTNKLN